MIIPDPNEAALESNGIAELIDTGELRAARRALIVTRRFRSRTKAETANLALEVAANMIAVHVIDQAVAAAAIAEIRKVQAVFGPDEPEYPT
jgi:hypothetical protein